MILIADSGSSKTIWVAESADEKPVQFRTKGYNPLHTSSEEIVADLKRSVPDAISTKSVEKVYFFGAGCAGDENIRIVDSALIKVFPNASVSVASDMEGASIALYGNEKGIACIVGTGSNAALWDGNQGVQFVKPLGYTLGDEGSGAAMGIVFLKRFLRKQFSHDAQEYFEANIGMSQTQIMNKIYKSNETKSFLASFVPLMGTRVYDPQIREIVFQSFTDFVEVFVKPIPEFQSYSIAFCGSPAYWFQDILRDVLSQHELSLHKAIANPADELFKHYVTKVNNRQ